MRSSRAFPKHRLAGRRQSAFSFLPPLAIAMRTPSVLHYPYGLNSRLNVLTDTVSPQKEPETHPPPHTALLVSPLFLFSSLDPRLSSLALLREERDCVPPLVIYRNILPPLSQYIGNLNPLKPSRLICSLSEDPDAALLFCKRRCLVAGFFC